MIDKWVEDFLSTIDKFGYEAKEAGYDCVEDYLEDMCEDLYGMSFEEAYDQGLV